MVSSLDQGSNKLRYFDHYEGKEWLYRIYERPYLQEFLNYIFARFNIAVWTAAEYNYGRDILEHFITLEKAYDVVEPEDYKQPDGPQIINRTIDFFFSKRTFEFAYNIYRGESKPLRYLYMTIKIPGYNACNTFIVDDNPEVYKSNQAETIRIKPFVMITELTNRPISSKTYLADTVLLGVKEILGYFYTVLANRPQCWKLS